MRSDGRCLRVSLLRLRLPWEDGGHCSAALGMFPLSLAAPTALVGVPQGYRVRSPPIPAAGWGRRCSWSGCGTSLQHLGAAGGTAGAWGGRAGGTNEGRSGAQLGGKWHSWGTCGTSGGTSGGMSGCALGHIWATSGRAHIWLSHCCHGAGGSTAPAQL